MESKIELQRFSSWGFSSTQSTLIILASKSSKYADLERKLSSECCKLAQVWEGKKEISRTQDVAEDNLFIIDDGFMSCKASHA